MMTPPKMNPSAIKSSNSEYSFGNVVVVDTNKNGKYDEGDVVLPLKSKEVGNLKSKYGIDLNNTKKGFDLAAAHQYYFKLKKGMNKCGKPHAKVRFIQEESNKNFKGPLYRYKHLFNIKLLDTSDSTLNADFCEDK